MIERSRRGHALASGLFVPSYLPRPESPGGDKDNKGRSCLELAQMFGEQGKRVNDDKDRGTDIIDLRDKAGHLTRGTRMLEE